VFTVTRAAFSGAETSAVIALKFGGKHRVSVECHTSQHAAKLVPVQWKRKPRNDSDNGKLLKTAMRTQRHITLASSCIPQLQRRCSLSQRTLAY